MTAQCIYEIHYPAFADLGPDEITLSKATPTAAVLFVHPDAAPKDDREEARLAFLTFAAAAASALDDLKTISPDDAAALAAAPSLPLEYAPLSVIYAETPATAAAPCNGCEFMRDGFCTSPELCRKIWP